MLPDIWGGNWRCYNRTNKGLDRGGREMGHSIPFFECHQEEASNRLFSISVSISISISKCYSLRFSVVSIWESQGSSAS